MRLASLFSDHAVLQRGMRVPVWGWAEPGAAVIVSCGQAQAQAIAGSDGKFLARLPVMKEGGPHVLKASSSGGEAVAKDVWVGEVWLASGQSNMAMTVGSACEGVPSHELCESDSFRMLNVPGMVNAASTHPDLEAYWAISSEDGISAFSAVASFFAKAVAKETGLKVGVINSSLGGTVIEAWTSRETLVRNPVIRPFVERYEEGVFSVGKFAKKEHVNCPHILFDSMIAPLIPYAIRGAIWYQGESNANAEKAFAGEHAYHKMLVDMVRDWRFLWGQGDFPFYIVQLANYETETLQWPVLREAQLHAALSEPNAGLVVAIDVGEAADIHPKDKRSIGERLARWALAQVHGRHIEVSGPLYQSMSVDGFSIRLEFSHLGGGLVAKGGSLKTFEIAGSNGVFMPAKARIEGDFVRVWSPDCNEPVAVRYAWSNCPGACNLYNKSGLPASPFRTDSWPN